MKARKKTEETRKLKADPMQNEYFFFVLVTVVMVIVCLKIKKGEKKKKKEKQILNSQIFSPSKKINHQLIATAK